MTARVARLLVYPVKSLDGQEVESVDVLANGALACDRAYALFDACAAPRRRAILGAVPPTKASLSALARCARCTSRSGAARPIHAVLRVAVNTRTGAGGGGRIRLGDEVRLDESELIPA